MHRMTRLAGPGEIRAPFDGATYRYKDDEVTVSSDGEARWMALRSGGTEHRYRVTRVIGGRYREDYAGVEPGAATTDELILPVSFVYATRTFRPKGYSVMSAERPGLRAGPAWNRTCLFCHNTVPLLSTALGALRGPGAAGYQGEMVDALLPSGRRAPWRVADEAGLRAALGEEMRALGGVAAPGDATLRAALDGAIATTRDHLDGGKLIELGIGCESCHGGSAEHAEDPSVPPSDVPVAPWLTVEPSSAAEATNRICARCHQVLFSGYPYTWEGRGRRGDPGGSHINSGEARDFLLGSCSRAMACTACHDPHGEDAPGALARLRTPAGNAVCTGCHRPLAEAAALAAHAKHRPGGEGGACLNCHMPRKNVGLGYQLTGYHRIGSPTDPARVEGDRPLECALCHTRASTSELVGQLERLWGRRYDRGALAGLYGDLDRPTLVATLERGRPHEQAAALGALAERGDATALASMLPGLENRYPLIRYFARASIQRLAPGCRVDVEQPVEQIRAAARRCLPLASLR